MGYANLAMLKDFAQIGDSSDDLLYEVALEAASDQIDQWCRRTFTVPNLDGDPQERTYPGRHRIYLDVVEVDTVEAAGATVGYTPGPANNPDFGRPYFWLDVETAQDVTVTGWFGWPQTPPAVVQATVLQASRLAQRRNAQFGVAPVPGLDGSGMRLLAKLDADVELLLAPYRRDPVLV
jgi:hypothetical protein